MRAGFAFDPSACIGCQTCVAACMDAHDLTVGQHLRRVQTFEQGTWQLVDGIPEPCGVGAVSVSLSCNHCAHPVCAEACPRQAIQRDELTGVLYVDAVRCIGCGKCRKACPYDAPQIMPRDQVPAALSGVQEQPEGTRLPKRVALKCDFCRELPEGPACAAACPMRCLHAGDIDALRFAYGSNADGTHLPASSGTQPNLIIIR